MILDDLGGPGLRLVVCGMAAGDLSAERGAYYADPGNSFWTTMYAIGMTPDLVRPVDWRKLAERCIGFTDLVKHHHGIDASLPKGAPDPERVRKLICQWQPHALAFNGMKAAKVFIARRKISPGLQPETIGATRIWALPSTSGMARRYWDITHWQALADSLPPV